MSRKGQSNEEGAAEQRRFLAQYQKTLQTDPNAIMCTVCGQTKRTPDALRAHQAIAHPST